MTSWMKERDRLVEQTLAFVQGVAAQQPITIVAAAEKPTPAAVIPVERKPDSEADSVETDALISLMTLSQSAPHRDHAVAPPEPIATAEPVRPIRMAAQPPIHKPAARQPIDIVLPEREVIAQRVARFRAGQQKLIQDREDYYDAVRAKIRDTLGTDPAT